MANYSAGNYKKADSIFCGTYESKYPNEVFGYLWCAKSKQAQDDSLNSQGLAVDAYEKLASFAQIHSGFCQVQKPGDRRLFLSGQLLQ